MSPLARFVPPPSPVDAITKALNVAETVYGIKGASQKAEQIQREMDLQAQQNDPTSDVSHERQATTGALLGTLSKSGLIPSDQNDGITALIPKMSATNLEKDPSISALGSFLEHKMSADAMAHKYDPIIDQKNMAMENSIHQKVLGKLQNDKPLQQRLTQYQNLQNSLNLIANSDNITPQQFDEAQQSIRSNLGIKGGSGVDERSHTYLNSLGLNADRIQQIVTGKPANMSPDDPFLQHVKQLAGLEQSNIKTQMGSRIKALTAGNESMYARRPDLRLDLENAVAGYTNQIPQSADGAAQEAPSEPGGLAVVPGVSNASATPAGHISMDKVMAEINRRRAMKKR